MNEQQINVLIFHQSCKQALILFVYFAINFMQPYGLQHSEDKGLFTFYKQQEQVQKSLKLKTSPQNLNKILNKVMRNNQEQKKNLLDDKGSYKLPLTERPQQKMQPALEQKASSMTKRQQFKLKKSIIHEGKQIKPENQEIQVKNKRLNNYPSTKNFNLFEDKININHHKDEEFMNHNSNGSFSKYMSELDQIKAKKKAIIMESYSYNEKTSLKDQSPKLKRKRQKQNSLEENQQKKIILHFKKIALEPQEFEGLADINKNFAPIAMQKREKSALKSYRKEKLKVLAAQINRSQRDSVQIIQSKQKFSVFDRNLQKNLSALIPNGDQNSKKLIRVQKLSHKSQKAPQNEKIVLEEGREQSLPKIKFNLPQISSRRQQNNKSAMCLQLKKSHQLKNKYHIRALQKQDEGIISLNQKLRQQLKQTKLSPDQQQVKHYISMRYSPSKQDPLGNLSERQYNSIQFNQRQQRNSIEVLKSEEMSFKKQKQIFCKREEYLKSYSKKIKKNIFSIEKEEESKIKQAMEEKKREIIENLMDKLKFL